MIHTDILIVGAGPAGLSAAKEAGASGAKVLVLERSHIPGGQLVKQTHMFFGSEKQYASYRGFDIADILLSEIQLPNVTLATGATALAVYDDGIWTAETETGYTKIRPKAVIIATGAGEKTLPFPGNDLPGVYGAGAVQTLMNQYGIKPANRVVMLGAGNIGLIVSYQLLQAGVEVLAVLDAGPKIGGYLVHAAKLRRMGVPIYTSHSVKLAAGCGKLESVVVWELDNNWQGIPGTEKTYHADALCVAVGLAPLSELLWQAGCEMVYVSALGGYVPYRDSRLATSRENIFIAGDVAGIEEASGAMVEGRLAGMSASEHIGFGMPDFEAKRRDCMAQLESLRHGHTGARIISGLAQATIPRAEV